jgi:preprotein translocase subunit YajC
MEVLSLAAFLQDAPPTTSPGTANQGTANQGTANQGTANQGTANQGTAGDGTTATTGVPEDPGVQQPSGGWISMLNTFAPFAIIMVIFYFLLIAPDRKQRKKREAMIAAVKKGDKVLTTGGMYATVAAVNEDSITLLAADDVRLRFSRQAIAQVLEPSADASDKG